MCVEKNLTFPNSNNKNHTTLLNMHIKYVCKAAQLLGVSTFFCLKVDILGLISQKQPQNSADKSPYKAFLAKIITRKA